MGRCKRQNNMTNKKNTPPAPLEVHVSASSTTDSETNSSLSDGNDQCEIPRGDINNESSDDHDDKSSYNHPDVTAVQPKICADCRDVLWSQCLPVLAILILCGCVTGLVFLFIWMRNRKLEYLLYLTLLFLIAFSLGAAVLLNRYFWLVRATRRDGESNLSFSLEMRDKIISWKQKCVANLILLVYGISFVGAEVWILTWLSDRFHGGYPVFLIFIPCFLILQCLCLSCIEERPIQTYHFSRRPF